MNRCENNVTFDAEASGKMDEIEAREADVQCNLEDLPHVSSNDEESVGECCAGGIETFSEHKSTQSVDVEAGVEHYYIVGDDVASQHLWPIESEPTLEFRSSTNSRMLYHWKQEVHNYVVSEKNTKRYDAAECCVDDSGNDDDIDTADCSDEDSYQGSLDICGPVDEVEDIYTSKLMSAHLSSPSDIVYCDSDGDNGSGSGNRSEPDTWKPPECDDFCRDFRESIDRIRDRNNKVYDESYDVAESADTDYENNDSFSVDNIDSLVNSNVPVDRLISQCVNEMPISAAENNDSSSFIHHESSMAPADVARRILSQFPVLPRNLQESSSLNRYRSDETEPGVRYHGASTVSPTNLFSCSENKYWSSADYHESSLDLGARNHIRPATVGISGNSWNRTRRKNFADGLDSAGNSPKDDDDESDDEVGAACPDYLCRKDVKNGVTCKGDSTLKRGHSKDFGAPNNDNLRSGRMEVGGIGSVRPPMPQSVKHSDENIDSDTRNFVAELRSTTSHKDEQRLRMMRRRRERRENAAAAGLSQADAIEGYLGDKQFSVDELVSYIDSQPNDPGKGDKKLTGRRKSPKKKKNVEEKSKVRDQGVTQRAQPHGKLDPNSSDSSTVSPKETVVESSQIVMDSASYSSQSSAVGGSQTDIVQTRKVDENEIQSRTGNNGYASNKESSERSTTAIKNPRVPSEILENLVPQSEISMVSEKISSKSYSLAANMPVNIDSCLSPECQVSSVKSADSCHSVLDRDNIKSFAIVPETTVQPKPAMIPSLEETFNVESVGVRSFDDGVIKQTFSCEEVVHGPSLAGTSTPGSSISDARESLDFDCRSLADDSTGVTDWDGFPRVSDTDNVVHCFLDDGNFTVVVQKRKRKVTSHRDMVSSKSVNRNVEVRNENYIGNESKPVRGVNSKWSSGVPKSKILHAECTTKLASGVIAASSMHSTVSRAKPSVVELKKTETGAGEPREANVHFSLCKSVSSTGDCSSMMTSRAVATAKDRVTALAVSNMKPAVPSVDQLVTLHDTNSSYESTNLKTVAAVEAKEDFVKLIASKLMPENCFVMQGLPRSSASNTDATVNQNLTTSSDNHENSKLAKNAVAISDAKNTAARKSSLTLLRKVAPCRPIDRVSVFLDTRQPLAPSNADHPKISFGFVDDTETLLTCAEKYSVPFSSVQTDNWSNCFAPAAPEFSGLKGKFDNNYSEREFVGLGSKRIDEWKTNSISSVLPRTVHIDSSKCDDDAGRVEFPPTSSMRVVQRQEAAVVVSADAGHRQLVVSSQSGPHIRSSSSGFNLYNVQQFLFTAFEETMSAKRKGCEHAVLYSDLSDGAL